jgi:hypothetical protein
MKQEPDAALLIIRKYADNMPHRSVKAPRISSLSSRHYKGSSLVASALQFH